MGDKVRVTSPVTRKDHFNEHEFNKIRVIAENDPEKGLELYEKYFKLYPEDYSAYTYYASVLISTGKLDQAKKIIKNVEKQLNTNKLYLNNKSRFEFLKFNILFCTIKLLMFEKKWAEALELYNKNSTFLDDIGPEVKFYIEKQLNMIDTSRRRFDESYILRQIRIYREDDFRDHMKKHEQDYNTNIKEVSISYFSYDFPMDKAIDEIKKHIPGDKRHKTGFFEDAYTFKCIGCGRYGDKIVDYFKVITFRDTGDIITMCPVPNHFDSDEEEKFVTKDITEIYNKKGKEKVISGIDRFNKRYNRA